MDESGLVSVSPGPVGSDKPVGTLLAGGQSKAKGHSMGHTPATRPSGAIDWGLRCLTLCNFLIVI